MCFAPQPRALFAHLNLQKCSDNEAFWTLWLRNVPRATATCTFWTAQLPKVLRQWSVLNTLASKCAPRHSHVHFLNSSQKCSNNEAFWTLWLRNVPRATATCTFWTAQLPKVLQQWSVLNTLASKCASRHSHVHFLNSSTSKSAPTMKCFEHFGFEMCLAPQPCALFEQLNFQKCSNNEAFWMCLAPQPRALFEQLNFQKCSNNEAFLNTLASKCASRHSHVHVLNSSTSKSAPTMKRFEHFGFEMCLAPQPRARFEQLNLQKCSNNEAFWTLWLRNVPRATATGTFWTAQLPKVLQQWSVLNTLASKCASRHSHVHFLNSSTSKSAPTMKRFEHFGSEMCLAPQPRALFEQLNFQKCSNNEAFWTLWLRNVPRATATGTFWTAQLPKVLQQWSVLNTLASKCASRHSHVHFLNSSTSKSAPMKCFSHFNFEICFGP